MRFRLAVLLILALTTPTAAQSNFQFFEPVRPPRATQVMAHRGKLIAKAHKAGIQVFSDAMGANERIEQYQKAIGWGIDVIQTDHPLRVLRAIELLNHQNLSIGTHH